MPATVRCQCKSHAPDALALWAAVIQRAAELRDAVEQAEAAGVLSGRQASSIAAAVDEAECETLRAVPRRR